MVSVSGRKKHFWNWLWQKLLLWEKNGKTDIKCTINIVRHKLHQCIIQNANDIKNNHFERWTTNSNKISSMSFPHLFFLSQLPHPDFSLYRGGQKLYHCKLWFLTLAMCQNHLASFQHCFWNPTHYPLNQSLSRDWEVCCLKNISAIYPKNIRLSCISTLK